MDKALVVLGTVFHHGERVDEIAVNGVERAGVVIRGSANGSQINSEICHLDEAFEARVVFDVEAVEGDAAGPGGIGGFEEVFDLVVVDVEGEDGVRGFGHELLAEMRAYEAASADHADRKCLHGVPVQIHSRHCCEEE